MFLHVCIQYSRFDLEDFFIIRFPLFLNSMYTVKMWNFWGSFYVGFLWFYIHILYIQCKILGTHSIMEFSLFYIVTCIHGAILGIF